MSIPSSGTPNYTGIPEVAGRDRNSRAVAAGRIWKAKRRFADATSQTHPLAVSDPTQPWINTPSPVEPDIEGGTPIGPSGLASTGQRRKRRWRRAAATGTAGIAAQASAAVVALISIPLTVGYLGVDRYATWVLISSFVTWLTIADFGLGSALVNGLAVAYGHGDREYGRKLVSTAFWAMALVVCLLGPALILGEQLFSWHQFFGSARVPNEELHAALVTAVLCFCLGFPLTTTDAVYRGLQEGYKFHLWSFIGSICSLGTLIAVTTARGGLPMLVFALLGVRSVVRAANFGVVFLLEHRALAPHPKDISASAFRYLIRLGAFYFVQQIAGIGMFQLQPVIIAKLVGLAAVAEFNVAYRLYGIPVQVLFFVMSPFIAAYSEASAIRDIEWLREAARKTVIVSVLTTSVVAIALTVVAPTVIHKLAYGIPSDTGTIYWLGLYIVALAVASPLAAFVQGLQAAKQVAWASLLTSAGTAVGGALLVSRFGPAGMAAAMTLALCMVNIPLLYRAGRAELASLERPHSDAGTISV